MIITIYPEGSVQENHVITDPKVINFFNDNVNQIKQDFLKLHNTINRREKSLQWQSRQIDRLKKKIVGGNLCLKINYFYIFLKKNIA